MQVALRPRTRLLEIASAAGLGIAVAGCAALGLRSARSGALPEPTVAAGLKEALQIGAERSVSRAARPGGFLDDPQLRIRLPGESRTRASGLHAVGSAGRSKSWRSR